MKKLLAIVLTAAMLLAMLCACAAKPTETAATDTKATIGILMPTKEQTIWSIQGERLTEAFQKAGYATQIEYAEDDSAKQAMQIENMITKGVNVLVIAAVDCAALTDACEKAKDAGIYVIADDRLIVDKLDLENQAGPFTLEIFSGSQDDTNAISFYQGAMNKLQPYLDNGKLVVKSGQSSYTETAIQSWDSSKAQSRMDNLLSGYYADSHLDAVLVAADCLALGVISSLESMGYGTDANPYPIVTGQDAIDLLAELQDVANENVKVLG